MSIPHRLFFLSYHHLKSLNPTRAYYSKSTKSVRASQQNTPSCFRAFHTKSGTTMSTLSHQTDPSQHAAKLEKTAAAPADGKAYQRQSDISKMTVEKDGSFKRKASTFRNWIQEGGEFVPEKGTPSCLNALEAMTY